MKKIKLLSLFMLALAVFLVACGGDNGTETEEPAAPVAADTETEVEDEPAPTGDLPTAIALISREEGSGARGAFEELVGVNQEEDGSDEMTSEAIILQGNGGVLGGVQETAAGITYIAYASFAGAGDSLRGLLVNGVEPTTENMLSGAFPLVREFNFVYRPEVRADNEIVDAFIEFAQSAEGVGVLASLGAVVDPEGTTAFDAGAFGTLSGSLTFGGSTSTEATALALIEEFQTFFPNVSISYDPTGSGAGINGAIQGDLDLGFASREIRDSEVEEGINFVTYCLDGLVIVVNPENDITEITIDQLRAIWLGELTSWDELR